MTSRPRPGRQRRARFAAAALQRAALPALAVALVALVGLGLAGCGAAAIDRNEPNDGLNDAHALAPGESADGVIGANDSDVFAGDVPAGGASHSFTVTVRSESPLDLELQVGASIPDVWEAITWPGWKAVTLEDRIEVVGELRKGTVLMFLKGAADTEYSIDIAWK